MTNYEKKNASVKGNGKRRLVPIKDRYPKVDPSKLDPIKEVEKPKVDPSKLDPIKDRYPKKGELEPIKKAEKKPATKMKRTATPRATSGKSTTANTKIGVKNAKKRY